MLTPHPIYSDLNGIDNHDPVARKKLSDAIRDACINVGFLYGMSNTGNRSRSSESPTGSNHSFGWTVANHGIPEDVIHGTLASAKTFFSLPDEKKMEVCDDHFRFSL